MKNYDPAQIFVSFLGNNITGFADGTFVSADRKEDAFMLVVGADGQVARARSRNRSGEVSITLLATSASNDVLSAAHAADELAGTGVGPLFIKDGLGRTLVEVQEAWVKKIAKVEYGKEVGSREWVIECGRIDQLVGGVDG